MAAPSFLYAPDGTLTVPFTYTVAPTQQLTLESVQASFDGSGAGGDFIPCLSYYGPGGQLITRSGASTVTAGDSAEVSWFPFAEPSAAAAPPAAGGLPWAYFNGSQNNIVTATNTVVDLTLVDTSNSSMFIAHSFGGHVGIDILIAGLYVWTTTVLFQSNSAPAAGSFGQGYMPSWDGNLFGDPINYPWLTVNGVTTYEASVQQSGYVNVQVGGTTPNDPSHLQLRQTSGANANSTFAVSLYQLNPTPSTILG